MFVWIILGVLAVAVLPAVSRCILGWVYLKKGIYCKNFRWPERAKVRWRYKLRQRFMGWPVQGDKPVKDLIPKIVRDLGLPLADWRGHTLTYQLGLIHRDRETRETKIHFGGDETFSQKDESVRTAVTLCLDRTGSEILVNVVPPLGREPNLVSWSETQNVKDLVDGLVRDLAVPDGGYAYGLMKANGVLLRYTDTPGSCTLKNYEDLCLVRLAQVHICHSPSDAGKLISLPVDVPLLRTLGREALMERAGIGSTLAGCSVDCWVVHRESGRSLQEDTALQDVGIQPKGDHLEVKRCVPVTLIDERGRYHAESFWIDEPLEYQLRDLGGEGLADYESGTTYGLRFYEGSAIGRTILAGEDCLSGISSHCRSADGEIRAQRVLVKPVRLRRNYGGEPQRYWLRTGALLSQEVCKALARRVGVSDVGEVGLFSLSRQDYLGEKETPSANEELYVEPLVRVTIQCDRGTLSEQPLPLDLPIGNLIRRLVNRVGLSLNRDGREIKYRLRRVEDEDPLDDRRTLGTYSVRTGQTLHLGEIKRIRVRIRTMDGQTCLENKVLPSDKPAKELVLGLAQELAQKGEWKFESELQYWLVHNGTELHEKSLEAAKVDEGHELVLRCAVLARVVISPWPLQVCAGYVPADMEVRKLVPVLVGKAGLPPEKPYRLACLDANFTGRLADDEFFWLKDEDTLMSVGTMGGVALLVLLEGTELHLEDWKGTEQGPDTGGLEIKLIG